MQFKFNSPEDMLYEYIDQLFNRYKKSEQIAISGLKQTVLRSKTDAMRSERT